MSIRSNATPEAGDSPVRPSSSTAVKSTRCWRSRSDADAARIGSRNDEDNDFSTGIAVQAAPRHYEIVAPLALLLLLPRRSPARPAAGSDLVFRVWRQHA